MTSALQFYLDRRLMDGGSVSSSMCYFQSPRIKEYQFFKDLSAPFLRRKSIGSQSIARLARFFLDAKHASRKGVLDCIRAFSETDFTEDLKKLDIPTLILHGDDDQIVPIGATAMLSSKMVRFNPQSLFAFAARHVFHEQG
jgi:pimeloyl-ACP methyl ester carboxylesterase